MTIELQKARINGNVNLGWFMIEQADELETDNEFFMLWGRLRKREEREWLFEQIGQCPECGQTTLIPASESGEVFQTEADAEICAWCGYEKGYRREV